MIVESKDGKLYRDPVLVFPKWILKCDEEGAYVCKAGSATWNTARKHAKEGGVKCQILESGGEREIILQGRLVSCSVFRVQLKKPIPTPSSYAAIIQPEDLELLKDQEEILIWTQLTGTSSIPIGQKSLLSWPESSPQKDT